MKLDIEIDRLEELQAIVTAGRFGSIEEAVNAAIGRLVNEAAAGNGEDLSWAKPFVEEAEAELARGEGIPWEEARRRLHEHLDRLKP